MANFLRQIVSGDKSRFKDDKLGLELGKHIKYPRYSRVIAYLMLLDLVYVTDQVGVVPLV